MRAALAALAVAAAVTGCDSGDKRQPDRQPARTQTAPTTRPQPKAESVGPAPDAPLPRSPAQLAPKIAAASDELHEAVGGWRATNPDPRARPPRRITLLALYQQRAYRLLAARPALARATIPRLPRRARAEARDTVGSLHSLFTLTSLATESRFRTGPPTPPDVLLRHYREAQRRFGVRWEVLAGINFIESNFGRLRNVSNAGAVGPMQFLPSTWAAYGLGGDIRDTHDAIIGAANYLHASGAPASDERAVYAYNPSPLYVEAVLGYARRMRRDPRAFYEYWSWQSFKRTRAGEIQLTGPGAKRN